MQIEDEIKQQNFSQAISLANSFAPMNLPEENYQNFYKIYSTFYSGFPLPQTDYDKLVEIAEQCPLDGGKAVFEARALRNHIDKWNYEYFDLCEENEEKSFFISEKIDYFSAYPNPNNGLFSISNLKDKGGVFKVYDLRGDELYSLIISENSLNQIQLDFSEGMYFYKIFYYDNSMESGKLSIIK